jgi:hypothetical protein
MWWSERHGSRTPTKQTAASRLLDGRELARSRLLLGH